MVGQFGEEDEWRNALRSLRPTRSVAWVSLRSTQATSESVRQKLTAGAEAPGRCTSSGSPLLITRPLSFFGCIIFTSPALSEYFIITESGTEPRLGSSPSPA